MKHLGSRPVGWDGHLLLLYQTEVQRRAGISMWVRRGLKLGSKIFYTEPPAQPCGGSLLGLLQNEAEAREAVELGQIEIVPADEAAYDPDWRASMVQRALERGFRSVRWSGEAASARAVMPGARHADIELATDELCRSLPVSVMCQYSLDDSLEELGRVCTVHRAGVGERLFRASPCKGGLAVAGEIDRSNHEIVRSLLSIATSATQQDQFLLDLASLEFLDVEGARSLVKGTARYRELGGCVRLSDARPPVDSVIRLLSIDRASGVLMEAV